MMRSPWTFALALVLVAPLARAADIYGQSSWASLASDRSAHGVGDTVTVVVDENSNASDTATSNLTKSTSLQGQIAGGPHFNEAGSLGLSDGSDNSGTTQRSGTMIAQVTATVDQVFPNGDLHVNGAQTLNLNGEKTTIRVQGRVRLADIASDNSVLSGRLADAKIDYDGAGFVSASAQPGIITRALNWLGLP